MLLSNRGAIFALILFIFPNVGSLFGQPEPEKQAPSFYLRTLDGDSFFYSKYVGENAKPHLKKPLLMSFFATWCIPCKEEIPVLHNLQREYPGIRMVLVDVNEEPDLVKKYARQMEITLPVLLDRYSVVAKKYAVVNDENIAVLPQLVVITERGELRYQHQGFESALVPEIRRVLDSVSTNRPDSVASN